MRVLVLTDDELKKELLAFPIAGNMLLQFINHPDNLLTSETFDACIDLVFENTPERINWLKELNATIIVVNSVITPLREISPGFVRINGWPTLLKRPIIEAVAISVSLKEKAELLFAGLGRNNEWVPDIAGFITARVISAIVNEAFYTLEEKVSTESEIDTAMKLGTNYPYGPFEWGQQIGLQNIYQLLTALSKEEERYNPSALLKQRALA